MKNLLIIITGSIAAYKALEICRLFKKDGVNVTAVITEGGKQFITELSVAAITGNQVYSDIFSLKDECEMGHIRLARENDAILVAPASADIIAKLANGFANDLASAILLASNKPIIIAPAMNSVMWQNKAVQRNIKQLKQDKITILEPESGNLACGEEGYGRMVEPDKIITAVNKIIGKK